MTRRPCLSPPIAYALRNALALLVLLAGAVPAGLRAQVASQSVNMVSGIQWPGGDPFLQRQNEPSIAMSSRNPRHLLAGANDYRTVDIPFPPSPPNTPPETGDAWLGVFKSFDGGLTWKSTLLPGYPQQTPAPTGPLAGFTTAADPVVRAGTNGLFYYSGIAFNRGTNVGVLFVSRFMDLNNKENGDPTLDSDPIRYIDTQVVDRATAASSPFIDKPWIAVDKPRLLDGVCHLTVPQPQPGNPSATVSQTVPAGSVYAAWTEATGTGSSLTTNIFFSYSRNCGGSWSRPVKLNGTNKVNQGASIAIDPATGVINVVWRRFASGSQTDAIMIARSLRGALFSTPSVVASLPPYNAATLLTGKSFFDQGTSTDSFRTNAYPTIGIDRRPNAGTEDTDEPDNPTFRGRIFVAWSQRMPPNGDARVVLSVSTDGASTWSAPQPIDSYSLSDDSGTSFSRGHQFMPQMTVTADKITVIYYDARLDHTFGLFSPRANPLTPDPVTGKLYLETRALRGELLDPGGAARVFTPFFVETGMTEWRHTLDLRVAQADSAVSPAFTSARLSQYIFGTRGDETGIVASLQQLQINPPNLRLFQQGTVPFLGDYIDVAGPTFLPPSAPGRRWRFNSLPGTNPVFLASWTSNQDVRPPADGNWSNFTPPTTTSGVSKFDGSPLPACRPGNEGMRNQNIYAARISQGLAVSSVQNAKPLSTMLQRDLTVNVENLTTLSRTFRLTIASQPAGGRASFVPAPNPPTGTLPAPATTLDVVIPANSSVARSVYALSTDPNAMIEVDVAEVNGAPGSQLKTNGLTGFVIFNSDPSAPTLVNPDNSTAPPVTTVEVYNPNVTNPNVTNPNITNPNVTNPNVTNPNVTNAPVSDATYTVTNTGNTASTYHVQLAGTAPTGTPLQLIITKPYANPASLNCVLFEQQHNLPVASIVNPTFVDPNLPPNPAITDPSDGNATFVLGPGESILVTIRGPVDIPTLTNIIQNLAPVVVAHAPNSNDTTNVPATSPPSITTSSLPDGVSNQSYSATLTALGGTRPYVAWAATGLPAGLSIGATTGLISGTPSAAGTFPVGVSVTDSALKTGSRSYTLRIASPLTITTASLPNGTPGTPYSQPLVATGGSGTLTWSLATGSQPPPPGIGLTTAGVLSGTPTGTGTYPFTVQVVDSGSPQQTATGSLSITVGAAPCDPIALAASISAASGTTQTINLTAGCTYTFTAGSAADTLTALPHITSGTSLTINGNGATLQRSTVSGTPAFRLLAVDGGGTLNLNSVSVTNGGCGNGASCNNLEGGGAFVAAGGTLNVVLSNFTGNQTGVDSTNSRGGAIESFGALTVDRSAFTSNQAQNNGGAIFNFGGTLTVTNSTFASNTAQNVGGAIVVFSPNASTITNSTFVGNTASRLLWGGTETGSAIYNQNGLNWNYPASGPLTVTSSTFAGNGANGAIATETGVATTLRNTILTGSAGTNCGGSGAATDGGFNISGDASCGFTPSTGSLSSTDPQLDPGGLSSAGGPTQVVVPLPGSPAVDAIAPGVNGCGTTLTTDQRGAPRPTGAGCDIGAVEFPPVLWGGATITNVQLNSGGNVLTLPGGGAFTLSHNYTVANDPSCPGCIDQIQVGLSINPGPQICSYFGIPPVSGVSGQATVGLTVPAASGTYYIGIDWSEQYSCVTFWSYSPPTPNRYIGKVIVP
ncbi:MAG TPA: putative Ig domain-containing protein [Thermoanaerobaculia bacterium]